MLFSSLEFLYWFLPIFLIAYLFCPAKGRNLLLLGASLLFYAWGEVALLWVMLLVIAIDFLAALLMGRVASPRARKAALFGAVAINILILAYFKYTDLLLGTLGLSPLGIILPLGISFYIFQAMSYVIDVYKGESPLRSAVDFGAYVTMFPQLVAGPIVRYGQVRDELEERSVSLGGIARGLGIFTLGLVKKVLLANSAGAWREAYLSAGREYSSVAGEWWSLAVYAFQIYYDFGGYSDMAVGLGRMLGFSFPRNFNYPYIAQSVTDFWRRWHITLSSWFREYVYIPLGGSRCSRGRMYFNLLAVWLLTGIWHGAEWSFLFWGLYFFLLLAVEKAFLLRRLTRLPRFVRHVYALACILLGWFVFTLGDGVELWRLGALFGVGGVSFIEGFSLYEICRHGVLFAVMAVCATPLPISLWRRLEVKLPKLSAVLGALAPPLALAVCTAALLADSYNPFLYFRF